MTNKGFHGMDVFPYSYNVKGGKAHKSSLEQVCTLINLSLLSHIQYMVAFIKCYINQTKGI